MVLLGLVGVFGQLGKDGALRVEFGNHKLILNVIVMIAEVEEGQVRSRIRVGICHLCQ